MELEKYTHDHYPEALKASKEQKLAVIFRVKEASQLDSPLFAATSCVIVMHLGFRVLLSREAFVILHRSLVNTN